MFNMESSTNEYLPEYILDGLTLRVIDTHIQYQQLQSNMIVAAVSICDLIAPQHKDKETRFFSKCLLVCKKCYTFAPSIKSSRLRADSPTERAASAEPNMFVLCRVAREEGQLPNRAFA